MVDTDILVAQVKQGDLAEKDLFESLIPVVDKIARRTVSKYPWLELEDLSQKMMLVIPAIIRRYDPSAAADFSKYAYHRLYFEAKDCCREYDPLGVSWPQKTKEMYPTFSRLGDEAFDGWEPEDESESMDLEDEELPEIEQVLMQLFELRQFIATQPKIPKRKRVRTRKYKVPEMADFAKFVRGVLGSRNKKQMLLFGV